jgi:hypothetical protein
MDNLVLYWCHAFNPSSIRIHHGCVTCDAQGQRISIYLNEDDTIKRIEQEVSIGGGTGQQLDIATREKIRKETLKISVDLEREEINELGRRKYEQTNS